MNVTHDEMIAIIAAHRDGLLLEWKWRYHPSEWLPLGLGTIEGSFDFSNYSYRVKPAINPREWRIRACDSFHQQIIRHTDSEAREGACSHCEIIHVREVLPEEEKP